MVKIVRTTSVFFLVALFILSWGCAFAPKSRLSPKEDEGKSEKEKVEQVEDFDPLSLHDDDILPAESKEQTDRGEREREVEFVVSPETEETKDEEQVQGYRVQIFVSSNLGSAQKIKTEAEEFFPNEVYLQYDAPYYKIRVGNCLTRREGDLLKERAVRHGYRDAWVVRSLVTPSED